MTSVRALVFSLLMAATASAQTPGGPPAPAAPSLTAEQRSGAFRQLLREIPNPDTQAIIGSPAPKVSFLTTTGDSEATAEAGVQAHDFTMKATVTGPLSKGRATLLDLSGLRGTSRVSGAVSWTRWRPSAKADVQEEVCTAYTDRILAKTLTVLEGDTNLLVRAPGEWRLRIADAAALGSRIAWDFGDGSFAQQLSLAKHAYEKPGLYQLVVTIEREGVTSRVSLLIAAAAALPPAVPELRIEQVGEGIIIHSVHVKQAAPFRMPQLPPGATVAEWDFGDGTKQLVALGVPPPVAVPHTYSRPGVYPVTFGVQAGAVFRVVQTSTRILAECSYPELKSERDLADRWDAAVNWGIPLFLAARLTYGHQEFTFLGADNVTEATVTEIPREYAGAAGVILPSNVAVQVSLSRRRAFKAGDATQVCKPLSAGSPTLRCDNATLGAPSEQRQHVIQLTAQKYLQEHLAIQPRFSYRVTDAVKGFELPFYFFQNKDKGLNGGASVGWSSDKQGVQAIVFVGAIADLIGLP